MATRQAHRKEQIVTAAIERLFVVGFEGFRLGDVAKDVAINNATLIHHFPSKVALITAVVERFTAQFESVAVAIEAAGTPQAKLSRHMQSSLDLMQTSPAMFVVLNEIMVRARRDAEIARLVAVPLMAWKQHIVSLLLPDPRGCDAATMARTHDLAAVCMAQLLGAALLVNAAPGGDFPTRCAFDSLAIAAITQHVKGDA